MDLEWETDVSVILKQWSKDNRYDWMYCPDFLLTRLAEVIEEEAENYSKVDRDPFDERHPSRAVRNCPFGRMLEIVFKKRDFLYTLFCKYLYRTYNRRLSKREVDTINTASCRLIYDIMPGLKKPETSKFMKLHESVPSFRKLCSWAEKGGEPIQTYATGLIAGAMEIRDIATESREVNKTVLELNHKLVPLMMDRLLNLRVQACREKLQNVISTSSPASVNFSKPLVQFHDDITKYYDTHCNNQNSEMSDGVSKSLLHQDTSSDYVVDNILNEGETDAGESLKQTQNSDCNEIIDSDDQSPRSNDFSNLSWAEIEPFVRGNVQIFPPTLATKQIVILKYLTQIAEYQEFFGYIIEKNVLGLILQLIDRKYWQTPRLTFEALRYLASILRYKKFVIEFVNMQGLQKLLDVPRIGISATGVSLCFLYLAQCEDAMKKICLMPSHIISKLIRYGLWLLECSHNSGRCHATIFFGLSFQFRVILKEFDAANGFRTLYNVLSTLPDWVSEETERMKDEAYTINSIVKHVCIALKRYFEAHLSLKTEEIRRANTLRDAKGQSSTSSSHKTSKSSSKVARSEINLLLDYMNLKDTWQPVNEFMNLGGVTLMLKIIAVAYRWEYSGKSKTIRSALDVINICSALPSVRLQLCELVEQCNEVDVTGIASILEAAAGEVVNDSEVQKSALNLIITCSCASVNRNMSSVNSTRKRWPKVQSGEDIILKVWDCIRTGNGIMVLLKLITLKTPDTDADAIRALACKALARLARHETARQIISKLPLFNTGQLQSLMNDPVRLDKRQEHAMFQKYALKLLEKVSGKSKTAGSQLKSSSVNMHKANVVAQTKIQYNDRQLLQIIHQYLLRHGLSETATMLRKEASLQAIKDPDPGTTLSLFTNAINEERLCSVPEAKYMKPVILKPNCVERSPIFSRMSNTVHFPPANKGTSGNRRVKQKPIRLTSRVRPLQKQVRCETVLPPSQSESPITLDSIINEYLANQHSSCQKPIVTYPHFDILVPHKCPEPKPKRLLYGNFTTRHSKGIHVRWLDEHLLHSKFCPVQTLRLKEREGYFTCCEFINDKSLLTGTSEGELQLFNLHSGVKNGDRSFHSSSITNLSLNSDRTLVVSSSPKSATKSSLWRLRENTFNPVYSFKDEDYFEFNNVNEDKLIGTNGSEATIYDIATGKHLIFLKPRGSNCFCKNRATFNPTDELVLSDGVVWDMMSGKVVHKFNQLNQILNGVFHPNKLEIISNAEVWDIRTFRPLRTVPSVENCTIVFPKTGSTFYAFAVERELNGTKVYDTSFKTLDAYDYTNITAVNVKKHIYHLGCDRSDMQIAVVENNSKLSVLEDTAVQIYDVGRSKANDEDAEDKKEENDDDDDDDDDDNDDSQDNNDIDDDDSDGDDSDDEYDSDLDFGDGSSYFEDFEESDYFLSENTTSDCSNCSEDSQNSDEDE